MIIKQSLFSCFNKFKVLKIKIKIWKSYNNDNLYKNIDNFKFKHQKELYLLFVFQEFKIQHFSI